MRSNTLHGVEYPWSESEIFYVYKRSLSDIGESVCVEYNHAPTLVNWLAYSIDMPQVYCVNGLVEYKGDV